MIERATLDSDPFFNIYEMKNVAKNISLFRKEKGLGQREMASMLGITHVTLWKIENQMVDINTKRLSQIANVLGVSIYDILAEDNSSALMDNTETIEGLRDKLLNAEDELSKLRAKVISLYEELMQNGF